MRFLSAENKLAVQQVIDANLEELRSIPGFVSAEPGFPVVDGAVYKEPAILVFFTQKRPPTHILREERAPRQLGPYRVSVMQADPMRQIMSLADHADIASSVELSSSQLTYEPIPGNPIDASFKVSKPMLCHIGPDAGWPVLKPFLEATRRTLSVAMYDLNADYIAKTLIDTVRDGDLKVMLTWDDSMTPAEKTIRKKLRDTLKDSLDGWIVRCGASRRFASAYHEKVAVRDSKAFWLSSGNWSTRSQPEIDPIGDPASARGMYSRGNREWHIIVEDAKLAKLFEKYIKHDRDGSEAEAQQGEEGVVLEVPEEMHFPDLFVPILDLLGPAELAVVEPKEPAVLPSERRPVEIVPVLTPDNYLKRINELLDSAERSIYLQFSYITYSGAVKDEPFADMLAKLADLTYQDGMDVRIIFGGYSGAVDKIRKLVEQGFKETVFRIQSNVHNKGIVVDGKVALVCSANWSGDGVLRNRDAGLIIHDEEIAQYYENVFLHDWDNRARAYLQDDPVVMVATEGAETPAGMVRMSWREYYG